ncbi:MAG TPA: hypothetical protein V6C81_13315 [Planktothrix sp.]|jgi:hypothetical protein
MKKTLLLPTSTQYGLLDELGARAARYANAHPERVDHRICHYDLARHGRYYFSSIDVTPNLRLSYGRKQGVFAFGRQRVADMAALRSVHFLSDTAFSDRRVELNLAPDFENVYLQIGWQRFRLRSRDHSPLPQLRALPKILTFAGPEKEEFGSPRLPFVVTEEATYAISLTLSRVVEQLEKGEWPKQEPLAKFEIHKEPVDIHPGLIGANSEVTYANMGN